jgi:hypothetical protein
LLIEPREFLARLLFAMSDISPLPAIVEALRSGATARAG